MQSGFKSAINQNKYQSKITTQTVNRYFNYLVDPSFQGARGVFVLLLKNVKDGPVRTKYSLPTVEIKDYSV